MLVFNVLNAVFKVAEETGVFASLAAHGIRHRVSFFADDVVLLVRTAVGEAAATVELMYVFGEASGLRCAI
jgi:hypothetical protein